MGSSCSAILPTHPKAASRRASELVNETQATRDKIDLHVDPLPQLLLNYYISFTSTNIFTTRLLLTFL